MKRIFIGVLIGLPLFWFSCIQEEAFQHETPTIDVDFSRVLFIGNSITKHKPAPEIDWFGDWGMAASAREKDFVHLLQKKFQALPEHDSIVLVTLTSFETEFWNFDFTSLDSLKAFEPNLLIVNLGENVDDERARTLDYGSHLISLINQFQENKEITVVCVNSFWDKRAVNAQVKNISKNENYIFVPIDDLENPGNQSYDLFENQGTGAHPNDDGMEEIANRIALCLGI